MPEYTAGDRVAFDDTPGTVVERVGSTRTGTHDYRVQWDNGPETTVWGSDLTPYPNPEETP